MSFASPFPEVDIPTASVYDYLFSGLSRSTDAELDAVALIDAKSGRQTTYREMVARIDSFAGALAARGIGVGDVVGLLAPNSSAFAVSFHGILRAGATSTTINALFTAKDIAKQLTDSKAKMLITVTPLLAQAEEGAKLAGLSEDALVVLDGAGRDGTGEGAGHPNAADLLASGAAAPQVNFAPSSHLAALPYSSGTTGNPKGVMISHDNIVFTTRSALQTMDIRLGEYTVSYLPLSHIAEQVVTLHGPMAIAGCSWFAESMDKLGANLQEVRPHWFLGVPRVWEKIQEKMLSAGANNPPLKKKIVAWARTQGLKGGYADQRGEGRPLLYGLANKLVFSTVREKLGLDRCRAQITSAAPISKSTLEFFLALGLPVYEVFGMSECTGPATISTPAKYATGKAGWALPGTELKIADDGEICMRGRHVFKGYFKNPDATAESMDGEGWLHSGDIGTIDSYGFLKITDRKKDLLITAGGENVAPQILEGLLKGIPVISQAVVIGDAKKYLAALLTLDAERVAATAAEAGSPARDLQSASTCPVFRLYLQRQIDEMNQRLAKVQTIKRWSIVAGEFTIEGGELTPTMKIKRKVIREKYAAEIDALYDESADAAGRSAA